jgi:hypothetical protein
VKRYRPCLLAITCVAALAAAAPATAQVDPEAKAIAESVLETMGGADAWNNTRHVAWDFFGRGRQHYWDKWTGDIRIEVPEGQDRQGNRTEAVVILMNLNSREGRAWVDGEEVDGEQLAGFMQRGWEWWVNDSYWMFMPYKLLDPGVNLAYKGEDIMQDDRMADVLELTFESVGVTPNNRYLVYVARDSGLVEQWSWFPDRADSDPGFTMPWGDWKQFGPIMLSGSRGRGADWKIAVYDDLPAELYSDPGFSLER